MELCTARGISNVSLLHRNAIPLQHSPVCRTDFTSLLNRRTKSGLHRYRNLCLRSTTSEETETTPPPYVENEPPVVTVEDTGPAEENKEYGNETNEGAQEGFFVDNQQFLKFLEDLDIKFDYEDTYSVLVFGGGAVVALWLASAVVGAVDSIPVLPKVLELVGLGYTIWFSTRYLIFKKNRDELVDKVEQIKQQVIGSKGD